MFAGRRNRSRRCVFTSTPATHLLRPRSDSHLSARNELFVLSVSPPIGNYVQVGRWPGAPGPDFRTWDSTTLTAHSGFSAWQVFFAVSPPSTGPSSGIETRLIEHSAGTIFHFRPRGRPGLVAENFPSIQHNVLRWVDHTMAAKSRQNRPKYAKSYPPPPGKRFRLQSYPA